MGSAPHFLFVSGESGGEKLATVLIKPEVCGEKRDIGQVQTGIFMNGAIRILQCMGRDSDESEHSIVAVHPRVLRMRIHSYDV